MKPFSLLIKPVSFDCNLRCRYCFYRRAEEVYGGGRHVMPDSVLDEMIRQMMGYAFPETVFGWQGGEPTLAGLDFFKRIVALQQKHGKSGQVVGNGLQTNATLIDDDWAKFLAKYNWLVGVSLDGPKEIHNLYRRKGSGSESFHLVLRGLKSLQAAGVAVNALVLVSQANVRKAPQVYRFLRDQKFDYLQFIPCVERASSLPSPPSGGEGQGEGVVGERRTAPSPLSSPPEGGEEEAAGDGGEGEAAAAPRLADFAIAGEEYGDFLLDLFEAWKPDAAKVSIRDFDAVRRRLIDERALVRRSPGEGGDICTMGACCDAYLLVEHNGDVYPCDFFMRDEWRLGNLMETPLAVIYDSPLRARFSALKSAPIAQCEGCEWLALCHGGCTKDREAAGDPEKVATALCAGWKKFLAHATPFFTEFDAQRKRDFDAQAGAGHG